MKILCICERGNSRSVGLAWILKDKLGHDALACGIHSNSGETMNLLYKWAERIVLLDKDFIPDIPQEFQDKLKVWDVGKDRFFQPPTDELQQLLGNYLLTDPL